MTHLSMPLGVLSSSAAVNSGLPVTSLTTHLGSKDISAQVQQNFGSGFVNSDSTKLFLTPGSGNVAEFDFGTAGDITTLSHNQTVTLSLPGTGSWVNIAGVVRNQDFTKLYGYARDQSLLFTGDQHFIFEWTLSTPGDLSTESRTGHLALGAEFEGAQPRAGIGLTNSDRVIILGNRRATSSPSSGYTLLKYDFGTAGDIATLAYSGDLFEDDPSSRSPELQATSYQGFYLQGSRFYFGGTQHEVDSSVSWSMNGFDITTMQDDGGFLDLNGIDPNGNDDPDSVIYDPNFDQLYWQDFEFIHAMGA